VVAIRAATGATVGTGCAANNRVKLGLCFVAMSFSKQSQYSVKGFPLDVSVCQSTTLTVTHTVASAYA